MRIADLVPKTRDPGNARQNTDALADLRAAIIIELTARHRVAGQRDVHDRLIVGIGFGKRRRRRQIHRQAAGRLGNRRLHIGRRRIDAFAQGELKRQAGVALSALGSDQFESIDLHELALERRRDIVGDGLGTGAGIVA